MHYILLIFQSEQWDSLSKEEKNQIHQECGAWHEALVKSGHSRAAVGLHPAETATTVRIKRGKPLITDGPFAETKEGLGGFEQVEARDLDEAIAIAQRFPALRVGFGVEVRPIVSDGTCHEA